MAKPNKKQLAQAALALSRLGEAEFAALSDEEKQEFMDKASAESGKDEDDGLVEVIKSCEILRVHPTCVEAHAKAGWKVA